MSYDSVDKLQQVLTQNIFHYARDSKKAAGRALGTFVEIITFYLLKAWDLESCTAIERSLPEFANFDIKHNVEYSLHPSEKMQKCSFENRELPITPQKIIRKIGKISECTTNVRPYQLLSRTKILRNACTICDSGNSFAEADKVLQKYFQENLGEILTWFNVISPDGRSIVELQQELNLLKNKNWRELLK